MRFTGQLDLQRTWERTLRRARVPVAYTQGFNPRPKINLGAALPLGCVSECDLADVWLKEAWAIEELLRALQQASPPGLRIGSVAPVQTHQPALQRQIVAYEYEVTLGDGTAASALGRQVEGLLQAPTVPRTRRGKAYDLRPLIQALELIGDQPGDHGLRMRLAALAGATGRPDEVLLALGLDPTEAHIRRTRLILGPSPGEAER
jgi:radical SAM-linked protein